MFDSFCNLHLYKNIIIDLLILVYSEHFKIMSDYIIDTIYFCLYEDFSVPFFFKIQICSIILNADNIVTFDLN